MIELEIDGKTIQAEVGEKLMTVCDRENIAVPRFCYHKNLSIAANCRMCLVDIEGLPKPQTACSTPVNEGMKVYTHNDSVKASQKAVMEFLLINHPLDCPICDQGGECELQDVAINYGSNTSFFSEGKRVTTDYDIGPLIQTDMTRCIHCTRCVRFGDEIAGITEMGATGRGEHMIIETFLESGISSELSGNMIDICPVGALTSKPFRFTTRSWQMMGYDTIARHDLLGSNINVQTYDSEVYRVTVRENEEINSSWISDRDRFSYESLTSDKRVLSPKIKVEDRWQEVSWQVALDFAIKGIKNSVITNQQQHKLAALSHPNATLEELFLLKKLMNQIGSENTEYRLNINSLKNYSYLDSTIKIQQIAEVKDIVIVGGNPRLDEPMLNYRIRQAVLKGASVRVIAANTFELNYAVAEFNLVNPNEFKDQLIQLELSENSLIILGTQINFANSVNNINTAILELTQKFSTKILNISSSANTLSARKIGFVSDDITAMDSYITLGLSEFDYTPVLLNSLEQAHFIIAMNSFEGSESFADVVLPIAGIYETSGTFINIDKTVQSFSASVEPRGESKPAWKVIKVLADRLELNTFEFVSSEQVKEAALTTTQLIDKIGKIDNTENKKLCVIYQNSCYSGDEYLRHATALQKTAVVTENCALMNVKTKATLESEEYLGLKIKIGVVADNCIIIYRTHLERNNVE